MNTATRFMTINNDELLYYIYTSPSFTTLSYNKDLWCRGTVDYEETHDKINSNIRQSKRQTSKSVIRKD